MDDNNNKDLVFAQLTEVFGDSVQSEIVNEICKKNNWQVENCIESLIEYNKNPKKMETMKKTVENSNETGGIRIDETLAPVNDNSPDVLMESEEFVKPYNEDPPIPNISSLVPKSLGAIPKVTNANMNQSSINFCELFKNNCIGTPNISTLEKTKKIDEQRNCNEKNTVQIENIIKKINEGYKIMILMRGPPGSGKSFLANKIIEQTTKCTKTICSADDYFYNVNNVYVFQREKLSEAHEFNQKRVRKYAAEGWSPIIIDNTNIKIWEMVPYVKTAVQHGYLIEILIPNTEWSQSSSKLAMKNKHGVPKRKIEILLQNFEPTTVEELIKMSRVLEFHPNYYLSIPRYRHYPKIKNFSESENTNKLSFSSTWTSCENLTEINNSNNSSNNVPEKLESFNNNNSNIFPSENIIESERKYEDNDEIVIEDVKWTSYEELKNEDLNENLLKQSESLNEPKPQRDSPRIRNRKKQNVNMEVEEENLELELPGMKDSDWKSYDEEANQFWCGKKEEKISDFLNVSKPQRIINKSDSNPCTNLYSLLKDNNDVKKSSSQKSIKNESASEMKLEKHKLGCPNESKAFLELRQIYPNKQIDALWDLYEKCGGNADWVVDILFKDNSHLDQQENISQHNIENYFQCNCDNENLNELPSQEDNSANIINTNFERENNSLEKLSRNKTKREKILTPEMLEAKLAIEKNFVFNSDLSKYRNFKHATLAPEETECTTSNFCNDDDQNVEIEENNSEADEIVEINLGETLVKQLESIFNTESNLRYNLSDFKTNVFMPKNFAKQLYAIWIESRENQIEEQRQNTLKEDKEFAQFLQNLPCENFLKTPKSSKDIMEMELMWTLYKSDSNKWKNSVPNDLASHITRMKLFEIFPNIPKSTLLEILNAHGNNFSNTVEVLKDSLKGNIEEMESNLLKEVKDETKKNNISTGTTNLRKLPEKKIDPAEAKKAVIKDFEESRNLAVHYIQLRGECYQKAKEAIQKGNHGTAEFYSHIANLHRHKIDMYNQKAANCIIDMQSFNQNLNGADVLDLHYLHVYEAIECLDVFIDRNITKMKNLNKYYNHIYIITGRGLHSAGGISTIKNKVKSRLRERNMTWSEVNPGLLKVRIFQTSKYSN